MGFPDRELNDGLAIDSLIEQCEPEPAAIPIEYTEALHCRYAKIVASVFAGLEPFG